MLEVEAKFRLPDPPAFRRRLEALAAVPLGEHTEADIYLNAPDRDFARTDESLRLRVGGAGTVLTYKGPRLNRAAKTRVECEAAVPAGPDYAAKMLELLTHLSYKTVAEVSKRRRMHELRRGPFTVHVCEDDVEKVGQFVEIEILVPSDEDADAATAVLHELAAHLQLTEPEPRSYLEQLLGRTVVPGGEKKC